MSDIANSVQVCVRVRPLNLREVRQGQRVCVHFDEPTSQVVLSAVDASHLVQLKGEPGRGYPVHKYYGPNSQSQEIYVEVVAPMIANVFKGFNGTVLAYGQTGCGKTHTMSGGVGLYENHEIGIIPLVIRQLFYMINEAQSKLQQGESINVSSAGMEIYNEDLVDLSLDEDQYKTKHTLRIQEVRHGKSGRVTHEIQGLSERKINSREELEEFFRVCMEKRATGSTKMNARSSRSHALLTIFIQRVAMKTTGDKVRLQTINSKLHLVDLAGSERVKRSGAQGQRLKEASNINQGLLALGNVIVALSENSGNAKKYIPYRDSKLTRILQDSLGGSSLTVLLACISPAEIDFDETNNTLKYANRACNIKNTPIPNKYIILDESLLPIVPKSGGTMATLTAALTSYFHQKKPKKIETQQRDQEQTKGLEKASTSRLNLSKEYARKLRENIKKGKLNFSKYQSIEGDQFATGRPKSSIPARQLYKAKGKLSSSLHRRFSTEAPRLETAAISAEAGTLSKDLGYESDGSVTEKLHRNSIKYPNEVDLCLKRSNSMTDMVDGENQIFRRSLQNCQNCSASSLSSFSSSRLGQISKDEFWSEQSLTHYFDTESRGSKEYSGSQQSGLSAVKDFAEMGQETGNKNNDNQLIGVLSEQQVIERSHKEIDRQQEVVEFNDLQHSSNIEQFKVGPFESLSESSVKEYQSIDQRQNDQESALIAVQDDQRTKQLRNEVASDVQQDTPNSQIAYTIGSHKVSNLESDIDKTFQDSDVSRDLPLHDPQQTITQIVALKSNLYQCQQNEQETSALDSQRRISFKRSNSENIPSKSIDLSSDAQSRVRRQETQQTQNCDLESTLLACLKINQKDIICVFLANTQEDHEDIVAMLPSQSQFPGFVKTTFIIARLLVNNDVDGIKNIREGKKHIKCMRKDVGPTVAVLMATLGTRLISSCIYNFLDPKEIIKFSNKERVELWGLQVPHSQPFQNQGGEGQEDQQPAKWSPVDRLNMSLGLHFALSQYARKQGLKCGFCVPKQALFDRWVQAGLKIRKIDSAKLVYPENAHDYSYYQQSIVAYFVMDEIIQGLQEQISLVEF